MCSTIVKYDLRRGTKIQIYFFEEENFVNQIGRERGGVEIL